MLSAYVDESYDLGIGVYILTASIVHLADAEETRSMLYTLRTGTRKLHWYKSDPQHRLELAKAVSVLGVSHTAVAGRGQPLVAERARRKCMEVLLPELEYAEVDMTLFEARQNRNNRHDTNMVDACRRKKLIKEGFHATFALPGDEPLLWIPDIACGSVLAAQRGDTSYLEQFGTAIRVLNINTS